MKFINESIYWCGKGRIFSCLNRLLQEVLGCAAVIILTIFLCKVKIFLLLEELTHNSIFYNRMEVCIVNWFESGNVTDMDQRPNGITCSTWVSFPQYGSSNFCGYQFVNQQILYSLSLLYSFLYKQDVLQNVLNSLLWISLYSFHLNLEHNY